MIKNYICENCTHFTVCADKKALVPFHEDSKKPVGIEITVNNCLEFKDVDAE